MKVRLLYRQDGGVSVIHPAPKSRRKDETEEQWLERVFKKANPENLPYKDIDHSQLLSRRFRNSWCKCDINGVKIDINKAKEQVLSELREARNKELQDSDGLMARAKEIGDTAEEAKLKAYRQKLRDLPQNLMPKLNSITDDKVLEQEFPEKLAVKDYLAKVK